MTPLERAARAAKAAFLAHPGNRLMPGVRLKEEDFVAVVRAVLLAIEPDDALVAKVYREGAWNCSEDEVGAVFSALIDAILFEPSESRS